MVITEKTDSLIFDMDGTLWDAVDSYATLWNMAFEAVGCDKRITRDELLSYMGTPIDGILAHFVTADRVADFTRAIVQLEYDELPRLGGKLYPGVQEGMARLAQHYRLFLLSNCDEHELPIFVRYAGLEAYITDVLSYGDTQLPKAENIAVLARRHKMQAPVYVGDTDGDCRESHRAGVPFVWMTYGFGATTQHDLAFDSFAQLTDHFLALRNVK